MPVMTSSDSRMTLNCACLLNTVNQLLFARENFFPWFARASSSRIFLAENQSLSYRCFFFLLYFILYFFFKKDKDKQLINVIQILIESLIIMSMDEGESIPRGQDSQSRTRFYRILRLKTLHRGRILSSHIK